MLKLILINLRVLLNQMDIINDFSKFLNLLQFGIRNFCNGKNFIGFLKNEVLNLVMYIKSRAERNEKLTTILKYHKF